MDGMDPVQVSYKESYFHYECGNVNVSSDRKNKTLCVTTVTCFTVTYD
jgi:hypothetical protein